MTQTKSAAQKLAPIKVVIACAQINPIMGDIAANAAMILAAYESARGQGADILLLPEMALLGYPPEDLVGKPALLVDCRRALMDLAAATDDGGAMIVGLPWALNQHEKQACNAGKAIAANVAAVLANGAIKALIGKTELPNYAVFDEKRVFCSGALGPFMPESPLFGQNITTDNSPVALFGVNIGIAICEDIWFPAVTASLKNQGAEIILVPNGSPFRRGAQIERMDIAKARVAETGLPLVYVNLVGGQDELVFDGHSFSLNAKGELVQSAKGFQTDIAISFWEKGPNGVSFANGKIEAPLSADGADYAAMTLALADYVNKNKFPGVVLGMSGGIDSALSAAVAVDALGPDRVHCVMLPSGYTGSESLEDAKACTLALGARYDVIPIAPAVDAFGAMLAPAFAGKTADTTEENIQSRTRAVVLMALSNKFGNMVLTTGNKSEMAVGYATLYGDMCGGYNVLKDLYKMEVYRLSAWRNQNKPAFGLGPVGLVIPERILTKAPSAELRPNQTDQDSLPPYPALDDMLFGLVEEEIEIEALVARGHAPEVASRIQHLLYLAEYKRRQAPPGVKIGPRNFGRDRRYPITNRYRDKID